MIIIIIGGGGGGGGFLSLSLYGTLSLSLGFQMLIPRQQVLFDVLPWLLVLIVNFLFRHRQLQKLLRCAASVHGRCDHSSSPSQRSTYNPARGGVSRVL
jgi:hypothetical protein